MLRLKAVITASIASLALCAWVLHPEGSAVWAAWVQTIGVLVAIGWSVRLQSLQASQGTHQSAQAAALFATNMHWVFRELNDACIKQSWHEYMVNRRILHEILSQGREVPLQLLQGRTLAMVTSVRAIGVEALEVTEAHTDTGNWRYLSMYFDKRLPSIAAWLSATGNPPENSGPTDYVGLRTSFSQLGGL